MLWRRYSAACRCTTCATSAPRRSLAARASLPVVQADLAVLGWQCMKRRLSVAISLIGGPRVVYLDEPSTGLDPAARRQLWDVVQSTKREKAIVLTTHSMEEAEGLCDRIGIFVDGRLVCLGNPKQLAARHVGCYMFTVTTAPDDADRMHEYVLRMSPTAERTYALAGTSKYELQHADTAMSCVFDAMEAAPAAGLDVRGWGLRSPSLEDVFVRITRRRDRQRPRPCWPARWRHEHLSQCICAVRAALRP
eukprot:jgi/Ulvmu1/9364/UM050_0116.1